MDEYKLTLLYFNMDEYKLTLFYFNDEPIVCTRRCPSDIEAIKWARTSIQSILSSTYGSGLDNYKLQKITTEDLNFTLS